MHLGASGRALTKALWKLELCSSGTIMSCCPCTSTKVGSLAWRWLQCWDGLVVVGTYLIRAVGSIQYMMYMVCPWLEKRDVGSIQMAYKLLVGLHLLAPAKPRKPRIRGAYSVQTAVSAVQQHYHDTKANPPTFSHNKLFPSSNQKQWQTGHLYSQKVHPQPFVSLFPQNKTPKKFHPRCFPWCCRGAWPSSPLARAVASDLPPQSAPPRPAWGPVTDPEKRPWRLPAAGKMSREPRCFTGFHWMLMMLL